MADFLVALLVASSGVVACVVVVGSFARHWDQLAAALTGAPLVSAPLHRPGGQHGRAAARRAHGPGRDTAMAVVRPQIGLDAAA